MCPPARSAILSCPPPLPPAHTLVLARPPPALAPLRDRVQAALGLLADLLCATRVPAPPLLPLQRAAAVSLTVEAGLKVLQEKAARLLVAAYANHPAQVWAGGWVGGW